MYPDIGVIENTIAAYRTSRRNLLLVEFGAAYLSKRTEIPRPTLKRRNANRRAPEFEPKIVI